MKSRGKVGAEVWVSAALFSISLNTPHALIYPKQRGRKERKRQSEIAAIAFALILIIIMA